jgi:glycosyltransferase involved in cell wall biosynthesis
VYYFSSLIGDFRLKYLKLRVPIILHVGHSIQGVSTYLRANPTMIGISELLRGKLIADSYGLARIFRCLTLSKLELKVMATTKTVAESLAKIGFNELKIKTLPLVVDEEFLKSKEETRCKVRESYGLSEDDFVVTYFGDCNPKKGVLELISAASIVRKKITSFKMLLLLRPPSSKEYLHHVRQRIIENKCQDYVIIMNKLFERNELINILACSDIVVLPFKYLDEEPPLTLLEAMALGKVVITTNVGPIKYIVGEDRGIILKHPSPILIANATYSLYQNEFRKNYIEKNAKNFAHTNFVSWHELANIVERELLINSL